MAETIIVALIVLAAAGYLTWKTLRISRGKERACACEMASQCPANTGCPSDQGILGKPARPEEIETRLVALRTGNSNAAGKEDP